jgi:hypothetical protein
VTADQASGQAVQQAERWALGRPGTQAAERRREAVRRILAGAPLDVVRRQLRLNTSDERLVAGYMKREHPWLAVVLFPCVVYDDDPFCPGVSPHPAAPTPDRVLLGWCAEDPGEGRLIAHTCECVMTSYQLLGYGGLYRVCRTTLPRLNVPGVSFAGGWRRREAEEWWRRLLSGQAR